MPRQKLAYSLFAAFCLVALAHEARTLLFGMGHGVPPSDPTAVQEQRLAAFKDCLPVDARVGYVGSPTAAAQAAFVLAPRVVQAGMKAPWVITDSDAPATLTAELEHVADGPDGLRLWRKR